MKLDEVTYFNDGRIVHSPSPGCAFYVATCVNEEAAKHIVRALNELTERARATREECGT